MGINFLNEASALKKYCVSGVLSSAINRDLGALISLICHSGLSGGKEEKPGVRQTGDRWGMAAGTRPEELRRTRE